MPESILALPVSVEQIALAIKHMEPADQLHLLDLVPDLRRLASQRTPQQAQESVNVLRQRVLSTLNGQQFSPEEPFLGNLTLQDYHALSEEEKARLWDT